MASISGKIDRAIDEIAMRRVKSFYPTYVAKLTDLPLADVYSYLEDMVKSQKLNLCWEVCCNSPGCCRTIEKVQDVSTILGKTFECDMCGEEVEVTVDNVFPVFSLNEEYQQERTQFYNSLLKKKSKFIMGQAPILV